MYGSHFGGQGALVLSLACDVKFMVNASLRYDPSEGAPIPLPLSFDCQNKIFLVR